MFMSSDHLSQTLINHMVCVYSAESHHLKRCNVVGTFNYLRLQFLSSLLRLRSAKGMDGWRKPGSFIPLLEAGNFFYIKKER